MKPWTLLLALPAATPAIAQTDAPPAVQPRDWSGWYAGVNVGYGFGTNTIDLSPASPGAIVRFGFVSPELAVSPRGLVGGVQLGRNWQQQQFVYGFEADFGYAGIKDTVVGPFLQTPFDFWTTHSQELTWFGTVRASTGVAVTDRALVFLSGGLAYGAVELSTFGRTANPCIGTNFCASADAKEWRAGWTIGAGMDYELTSNWTAKFEYLYYDLGTIHSTVLDLNPAFFQDPPGPDVFRGSARIKGNIVRAGLSYKFNP